MEKKDLIKRLTDILNDKKHRTSMLITLISDVKDFVIRITSDCAPIHGDEE